MLHHIVLAARAHIEWKQEYVTLLERDEWMREEGREEGRKEERDKNRKRLKKSRAIIRIKRKQDTIPKQGIELNSEKTGRRSGKTGASLVAPHALQ